MQVGTSFMAKAALIIAQNGFRDEEYIEPKNILEAKGIKVVTVSAAKGTCTGKLGLITHCNMTIDEALKNDFDGVFVVGGPGSYALFNNSTIHKILSDALAGGKVIGGICAGVATLAYAGLLKGKKATSFPGVSDDLKKNGALYTGTGVETDGKIITADGPQSATKFGEAIVKALR